MERICLIAWLYRAFPFLIRFTKGPAASVVLAIFFPVFVAYPSNTSIRALMGDPLYIVEEVNGQRHHPSGYKVAIIWELRPGSVDSRVMSGSAVRARVLIPEHAEVADIAVAGFERTPQSIDGKRVFLRTKQGKIYWLDLAARSQVGDMPQQPEQLEGKFSTLENEGATTVFAAREPNALGLVTLEELSAGSGTIVASSGLPVAVGTVFHISRKSIGARLSDLQLLATGGRYPADYSDEISDLRFGFANALHLQVFEASFQNTRALWAVDAKAGHVYYRFGDLPWVLVNSEPADSIQVLGSSEQGQLFLKMGQDYVLFEIVGTQVRSIRKRILAAEFFSRGLIPYGIVPNLNGKPMVIMQPKLADRTGIKRFDLMVRSINLKDCGESLKKEISQDPLTAFVEILTNKPHLNFDDLRTSLDWDFFPIQRDINSIRHTRSGSNPNHWWSTADDSSGGTEKTGAPQQYSPDTSKTGAPSGNDPDPQGGPRDGTSHDDTGYSEF